MTELWRLGVRDLVDGYRSGAFTPSDVLASLTERIRERDNDVHAFVEVTAAAGSSYDPSRELSGVPYAVKDVFDITGRVTRAGSVVRADARPATTNAAIVSRLDEAGAVLVGRTVTHEFAWGITSRHARLGGARNPHDRARIAGGSSGGSAAAVAAGMVPLAVGTDTGGSIRIPAAWCGVCGWKPTTGLVSTSGVLPLAPSLDTVGFLARSVADLVAVGRAVAGLAAQVGSRNRPRPWRVSLPVSLEPGVAPDIAAALDTIGRRLTESGVEVMTSAAYDGVLTYDAFRPIQAAEALAVHRDLLRTWPARAADYGPDVADRLRAAEAIDDADVASARERAKQLQAVPDGADALLLPVAGCGPPTIDAPDVAPDSGRPLRDLLLPFTVLANLTGAPAVSVPAGCDRDGLPIGVQVIARPGQDHIALAIASVLQPGAKLLSQP